MPDLILMATAMGLALLVSALMPGICAWWARGRPSRPAWIEAGAVLGIGGGFYLGCRWLGLWPHWPPREDLDRLLTLVVPAVLAVELLAAVPQVPRPLVWTLRLAVAGGTARVLLHGSVYLADPAGPGRPVRAWLMLGALALSVAIEWILLDRLAHRGHARSLTLGLGIATGSSALTIMLSGYATGGQAGLPMAAALLGAFAAAMLLPSPARPRAPVGIGVLGLFSLLVIGHFFGELLWVHAVLLFSAPLLAWLPELPRLRRWPPWTRGLARLVLVGVVVLAVLGDAARRFAAELGPPGEPGSNDPTIEDYMNSGR